MPPANGGYWWLGYSHAGATYPLMGYVKPKKKKVPVPSSARLWCVDGGTCWHQIPCEDITEPAKDHGLLDMIENQ